MANFATIEKGSKVPAQALVDSFKGIVAGSFGMVKAYQLALISFVLTGLNELTDAGSATNKSYGILDLSEEARKSAIKDMGFQKIFSSVRVLCSEAFNDLSDSQVKIAKNQFSQMFGPWLAISQIIYLGSKSQIAELSNALLYGPEDNSGNATPATFSNLARVAKAIRIDLILAEKNLSHTSESGVDFSTDGMRKAKAVVDRKTEELRIAKAEYATYKNPLGKAFDSRYAFMSKETPKQGAMKAVKAVNSEDVQTLDRVAEIARESLVS
tara:strand:- start:4 stop:810 length:807 start_codon:yes stop_codon:yes gene_type:complete